MQTSKKYSGSLAKDITELRNLTKRELYPTSIEYKVPNSNHLFDFMEWNKEFVVFCDCDTDGLSAAAICNLYFSGGWCNNIVHYQVASRDRRGFQKEDVQAIINKYPSATGILTVDCGITSVDAVNYAISMGIDVLITDHHNPAVEIPDTVIINPKLDNNYNGFKDFCGAGLIYLIMRENFGDEPGALQYAAIATIADMVPLIADNRYIVQKGMKELRNPTRKYKAIGDFFAGIGAFVLNEKDIGWSVAPTINSASRLGKESVAFNAYVMNDQKSIQELVKINEERKELVAKLYEYGKESAQLSVNSASMALGVAGTPGVLGLVAMKLLSEFGLPSIAYCVGDQLQGFYSMRAPKTSEFIDYLKTLPEVEVSGGGHDMAGGFSAPIGTVFIIDKFHEWYDRLYGTEAIDSLPSFSTDLDEYFIPVSLDGGISYDISIDLDNCIHILKDKDELRPFGVGFEEPIFVSRGVTIKDDGMTKNKKHKRFKFYQDPESDTCAVLIDFDKRVSEEGKFDIAYKISYNTFLKGPQIEIVDLYKVE